MNNSIHSSYLILLLGVRAMDLCYICHVSLAPGCGRRHLSGSVLEFLRVQVLKECFLCKECFRKAQRGYNCQATARNIYASVGGATRHTVVRLFVSQSVSHSVRYFSIAAHAER